MYGTEPVDSGVLEKTGELRGCKNSGKMRQILGETDPNSGQFQRCKVCEFPLCKEGSCWDIFHRGTEKT